MSSQDQDSNLVTTNWMVSVLVSTLWVSRFSTWTCTFRLK